MNTQRGRILVVDDEPDIVATLKEYLSKKGYEVSAAFSGEEALGFLEHQQADLILMDIMMPGIKGTDVSRIIKKKYPNVKVIILTGFPRETEELINENILSGMFTKPIRLQELYEKLSQMIDRSPVQNIDVAEHHGVMARLLFVQAKMLLVEPDEDKFKALEKHFISLAHKGENYLIMHVRSLEQIPDMVRENQPDLILVDQAILPDASNNILFDQHNQVSAVIPFSLTLADGFMQKDIERLSRTVEAYCFRNGLIDVRWIEL